MTTGTKIGYALLGAVIVGFMLFMASKMCADYDPADHCHWNPYTETVDCEAPY